MSKKYDGCMNFMVYDLLGLVNPENPMRKLRAQFDNEKDARLFIKIKQQNDKTRKYELLNNVTHECFTL